MPPHSGEAEGGFLGCLLLDPDLVLKVGPVRGEWFYDLRHREVWLAMKRLADRRDVVDLITLQNELRKAKLLDQVGGLTFLANLSEQTPNAANWSYYLEIIREKFALRKTMAYCSEVVARVYAHEGSAAEFLSGVAVDLETLCSLNDAKEKPVLEIFNAADLEKYTPSQNLNLIGDNEICMGYEGVALMAGPGSSGKSLAVAGMALAGCIGSGTWHGRKVHRKFKTLILQAENGKSRLKKQFAKMKELHPKLAAAIDESIFFSGPPEGGLAFHRPDFRAAVRRTVDKLRPDMVVLDTWAQVAAEDAAKDVMDKLSEIRACFPAGDDCPALLIVAHTSKPRPEQVRHGRALANLVSGSVALVNTARCVYMILPWSEAFEDDRIYFACPKLNNGEMFPASVWRRRFGAMFVADPDTDAKNWGQADKQDEEAGRKIKRADVVAAFEGLSVLKKADLVKRLQAKLDAGTSTINFAITPGERGYLADMFTITAEGWLQLKKEGK